jgi:malate dehydrogenase
MHEVAIVGAGGLGGELAHLLARRDSVRRIRLIDERGQVAAGTALDIMQAAPIEAFATQVTGSTDIAVAVGASLVVLADQAGGGEWPGEEGLMLLRRLSLTGGAAVLLAGATHRELVERAVRELRLPRTRVIGTAPEALAAALRALVALEVDGSPRDVALTVLGVPPSHVVVPWEDATIWGVAASRVLDAPARRRLASRAEALWPPGPHTLAWAAVAVVEAIAGKSRRTVSCFVGPDDAAGRRHRAAALPVRLQPGGIASVLEARLTPHDSVALDNAMLL